MTPLTDNPIKSKEGRYEIIDNFLSFWFLFIDKQRGLIEQDRLKEVENNFKKNFNNYLGRKFEKFILELLKQERFLELKSFEKFGNQWGKYNGKEGRNTYEIDILGLNEFKKEILLGECKWKDKVNVLEILNDLNEKSKFVEWNFENRNETFVIFAKSFSKKVEDFDGKKVYCFDLKEIFKRL